MLLHGGLHTIDLSFGALIPQLAASHRVIAVESQGHGRTADVDRDPISPHLADGVVALLDHLGIERADVLGFSLGGLVAIELGLRHQVAPDPEHWETFSEKTVRVVLPAKGCHTCERGRGVAPISGGQRSLWLRV